MDVKNKICYNCGEKGHIHPNCPKSDKRDKDNKSKHRHDTSDDEEEERKNKNKKLGKKKRHDKKTKLFPKKKRQHQEKLLGGKTRMGDCNTRFTKGHKPSNHIRARIKSHVYTTE